MDPTDHYLSSEPAAAASELEELREQNRQLKLKNATLVEQARIDKHKRQREARMKAIESLHPSTDAVFTEARARSQFRGATGVVAAVLAHGGTKNLLAYYDPGPHPHGKKGRGWHNAPAMTFERSMARTAEKQQVDVPIDFIRSAAAEIERLVDERMNTIHARVHRAINSIAWLVYSQLPDPGPEPDWWLLRDPERCALTPEEADAPADESTASTTDQDDDSVKSDFSRLPDDALVSLPADD